MFKIFEALAPDLELKPGDILFRQGEPGLNCFIIHSGSVDLFYNGRRIAEAPPGEILGEMALVDQNLRSATAVAGPNGAKLYDVSKERFLRLVKERPEFSLEVLRIMARRLRAQVAIIAG